MYSDGQVGANSVDPDETPLNAASRQGLHCLPLIKQLLDTTLDRKLYLFKILEKVRKGVEVPNAYCAFDIFQKVSFFFFFFVLFGALHRRSKFTNFCHDLTQNHLS